MYDVFFISYDETIADENWHRISSRLPHSRRVHGIKGIRNAHMACATQSFTEMFWTIDGDTVVDADFDFRFAPPVWDRKYLHLWYSRNPVNDLQYGYGSLKLWPRQHLLDFKGNWLDFTTTVGNIKIVDEVVATTNFNYDGYSTWKSAFRETLKLCFNIANGDVDESLERLLVWMNTENDVPFASMSRAGAKHGMEYFIEHRDDLSALMLINDFEWLKQMYSKLKDFETTDLYRNELTFLLKIGNHV